MKNGVLRSAAHNIADSFASGMGFPIGVLVVDVWKEASRTASGSITVDFLSGVVEGTPVSDSLQRAVLLYRDALPSLCAKQKVPVTAFRTLMATYRNGETEVRVQDEQGRNYVDRYVGSPLKRRPRL